VRAAGSATVLDAVFLVLSVSTYLLLRPHSQGTSLWFPPAGLALGHLLVTGRRGVPAVVVATVLGGLLSRSHEYAATPTAALAGDLVTAGWYGLVAAALVRHGGRGGAPSYPALTRFVVLGLVLGPVGAVTGAMFTAHMLTGDPLDPAGWARGVLGHATAIATITPAVPMLVRQAASGIRAAPTVAVRRRAELVAQALAVVLLPALFVLTGGGSHPELVLLPLALVPLAWLAFDTDLGRAHAVLAVCGTALGAAADLRFADGQATFQLQTVMFSGAVATLFASAGMAGEARASRGAELESRRWQALVEAAPAVVARIGTDGRWHAEGPHPGGDVLERAAAVPEVAAAVLAGVPATVQWAPGTASDWAPTEPADDTGRRFVTRITPLPDGETLAVTTETTRLHSAEIALAWERSHDRETDLPNRDLLVATADQALAEGLTASLLLVDLDHTTRRAALLDVDPARLLLLLGERLRDLLDPDDLRRGTALVARVGTDQFGLLLPVDVGAARGYADRVLVAVRAPVHGAGVPFAIGAWAGIAALDGGPAGRGARDALRRAEAALQAAAEQGRGHVVVLDGLSVRTSTERARLSGEVAHAVGRGELDVVFQPDVTLVDGRLTGVEALVRWRRPEGYAAQTESFVRLSEELGTVGAVDDWVMEESLRAMGGWRRDHAGPDGVLDLELGLNVSALSLTDDLPQRLARACARHAVPPGSVRLEVTETALADDGTATDVLRRVREQGVRVALDDFGTGYATLSRLRHLPIDVLKLDRSFLPSLAVDAPSQALVSLVLGLAGPLQVDVVAEGVETQEQRQVLIDLGCRRAQGYLFSRPTTAAAIDAILTAGLPLLPAGPALPSMATVPVSPG